MLSDALNVGERRKAEQELAGDLLFSLVWLRRPYLGMLIGPLVEQPLSQAGQGGGIQAHGKGYL